MTTRASTADPMVYAPLAKELSEKFMASLPDDVKQTVSSHVAKYLASDFGDHAKTRSDKAPDFRLPNVRGGKLALSEILREGAVVLSFYRGGWCPYCNLKLKALAQALPKMKELGARLVGVSPELPDNSLNTVEKLALPFDVLSDVGNVVARTYGVVMRVPEPLRPYYQQWGIDLPKANGDDSFELPIPATYVIDRHGIIRAAHVDRDYTKRMEPADIISALKSLNA